MFLSANCLFIVSLPYLDVSDNMSMQREKSFLIWGMDKSLFFHPGLFTPELIKIELIIQLALIPWFKKQPGHGALCLS